MSKNRSRVFPQYVDLQIETALPSETSYLPFLCRLPLCLCGPNLPDPSSMGRGQEARSDAATTVGFRVSPDTCTISTRYVPFPEPQESEGGFQSLRSANSSGRVV